MSRISPVLALSLALAAGRLAAGDSLWTRGTSSNGPRSLYEAERPPEKKYRPNDIILIIVEENGAAENNSNINLRRKFDLTADFQKFITWDAASDNLPQFDLKSEKRQEGRGSTDRREKIVFRISARILEVLPNGNLIIEAKKARTINDEESILTLFGEVSAEDISPQTRTVKSERIADMKLVYSGRGPVSRNLGRTILSWLCEWLWPF
jgi:flagellar L-ring protein FlgH